MAELGLVRGSSGNVSARWHDLILITPSGIPYEHLDPRQVMAIDLEGRVRSGSGVPSSEWRMHVSIQRAREDVRAIVHTHSPFATWAAVSFPELPVINDEGKILLGGAIPVSRHAPPGTWALAAAVVEALGPSGRAALIANHGAVAVGTTLPGALSLAEKLEEMARLFWLSKSSG
jgi:L-fuculose-phosphate aldolase